MAILSAGTVAPIFKGINITGPEINLENYKGKKTVVLVFSPDRVTPPEINSVKTLYAKVRERVEIITVARKIPSNSVSMTKMFMQQLGANFPTLYDPSQAVFKLFGVENPVAVFIIDTNGNIVYSAQTDPNKVDMKQLEDAIATSIS